MGFLDFLKRKASATHTAIWQSLAGQAQWSSTRFDSMAREGYNSNVWAYACINAIASNAASVKILLYRRKGDKLEEVINHPIIDLLRRPNEMQSGREFREEWAKYLLMAGRSFIEMNGPSPNKVTELWLLRPDRVAPVPDIKTIIGSYRFKGSSGKELVLPREKVIYYKLFDPLDELEGRAPLQVAARAVDQDNAANEWNGSLYQNGARPSGAFVSDNTLEDENFTRLNSQIKTKYLGKKNAGKPLLLEAGVKWQSISYSPLDVDFQNAKKLTRLEICAAFGVPPELVGDKEHATYSNYQEARASFYEDTILPFIDSFVDKLNAQLIPKFGEDLVIVADRDSIDALQENSDSLWGRVERAVDSGILTPNEGRELLGYDPIQNADILRVRNTSNLNNSNEPKKKSGNSKQKLLDDEDPFKKAFKSFNVAAELINQKNEDDKYYSEVEKQRKPYYKAANKLIVDRFDIEKRAVMKAMESGGLESVLSTLKEQEAEWIKTITAIWYTTTEHFGNWNYNRLKEISESKSEQKFFDVVFSMANKIIQKFIGNVAVAAVKFISETTREALRMVISDGIADGLSFRDISKNIEKIYGDDFGPKRSITIARTEVVAASNYGAHEGANATGLELEKTWIATPDDRTRDTHNEAHGQKRDMNEDYDIGGYPAMFPGDPKLPGKERIQCRCAERHDVK